MTEKRFIVLAGGFWNRSKELLEGRQVDVENDAYRMSDYIIAVSGLPQDFFKPEEVRRHRTYQCVKCDRPIPEGEMENKFGCWDHQKKYTENIRKIWRSDVFEEYNTRKKWMTPCYRIWVNNQQGIEKFHEIWRYIRANFPAQKLVPYPVSVGTIRDFTIESEDDIPHVVLDVPEEVLVKEQEENPCVCQECGYVAQHAYALKTHQRFKHKKKKEATGIASE